VRDATTPTTSAAVGRWTNCNASNPSRCSYTAAQYLGGDIEAWAREHGADIVRYPPNWQLHGKLAERLRNVFMLRDSRPDLVLALPGGDDTEELLARARGEAVAVVCGKQPRR
jgi:hypothetical protein